MMPFARVVALVVVLACPLLAWGHGFLGMGRSQTSYYYAVPLTYGPVYDVCPAYMPPVRVSEGSQAPPLASGSMPPRTQMSQSGTRYATPSAAPPSAGPASAAPPLRVPAAPGSPPIPNFSKPPSVSESKSYYDAYAVALKDTASPAGDRCSAEFWNLSNNDLTLKVDGTSRSLAHGKSLLLEVGRQFSWQVEGRGAQKENIAMGEAALEIVIRR